MVGRRRGDYRAGNRPVQRGLYRVEAFRGMAYRYAGAAAQETVVLTDRTQPFVITISDEYGSGDHRIGELLAQRLGVKFYDRELISLTAHIVMDESGRYGTDENMLKRRLKAAGIAHSTLEMESMHSLCHDSGLIAVSDSFAD
ncbi:cytidylate kinase family protein [Phocaeicola abscessus]|uniref:cytidylate kinase family protein n=1 Tax=Phocaeicola abscessus TaxID=555313 RepID=UPI00056039C4|nr:cytidylate kinase family protein [Phocaeicola abscessus]